jgi:hypothetical protein
VLVRPAKQLSIEIRDASGTVLRRFASHGATPEPDAKPYFAPVWLKPTALPGIEAGAHRFIWDLHLARPKAISYDYSIGAVLGESTPLTPQGALALPGDYRVVLKVDGKELSQPLQIRADPRVQTPIADLATTLAFSRAIDVELERSWQAHGEVEAIHTQLAALTGDKSATLDGSLKSQIDAFASKLEPLRKAAGHEAPSLEVINTVLSSVVTDVEGADRLPTAAQESTLADYRSRLDPLVEAWQLLKKNDLVALNTQLVSAGLSRMSVPSPEQIALGGEGEAKDLP